MKRCFKDIFGTQNKNESSKEWAAANFGEDCF
jgi:hypothetical protein